jgi:reactive intermediate/imine deaminase
MNKFLFLLFLLISNSIFAAKESIYTKKAPDPIGTYSQAIKIGNTIYISGQIPIDPKTGKIVEGSFDAQVKQSLSNVNEIAKAAGGNIDNIVKVSVYLSDINNFALLNKAMKALFHLPYPARSVVEIKSLPKNAMVEIEAVMQLDDTNTSAAANG